MHSLHIGVPSPSWGHFTASLDIRQHAGIARDAASQLGFETTLLDTPEATTWGNVWTELVSITERVRTGGTVFISFVGHGFKVGEEPAGPPGVSGGSACEQRDGVAEHWVLQDRALSELDVRALWKRCGSSTTIRCLSDACYGGGFGGPPPMLNWIRRFFPSTDRLAYPPRIYTARDAQELEARVAIFSPAPESTEILSGFTPVFAEAMSRQHASNEALRAAAEQEWKKRQGRYSCLRVYGPRGEGERLAPPFPGESTRTTPCP